MKQELRKIIKDISQNKFSVKKFVPGKTLIPVSGTVSGSQELINGVEAVLDRWWTEGRWAAKFEKKFSEFLGVKYVSLVNSGSSANLVALSALTSPVFGKRALKPGDEVITAACGFPTTVNPILQNRLKVVLVDSDPLTKNPSLRDIKAALSKKTRAIMLAHTLGSPLELAGILDLVKQHNLWFIEDCCDALGGLYAGKKLGTFGHIATFSFYPAHQITMGEGGAAVTNNPLMHQAIRQFRDWGRDCWCDTGHDDTCRRRFAWKLGDLPYGYDHKYIYSRVGYNLKLTDMQAAVGVAQLKKLSRFVAVRRKNFSKLFGSLKLLKAEKYFVLPEAGIESEPSWFGFPLVVRPTAPFTKLDLVKYLEQHKIATRSIFAGNILRHPAYIGRKDIRVSGKLISADYIMNNGFWIGVYPGITKEMMEYVVEVLAEFVQKLD